MSIKKLALLILLLLVFIPHFALAANAVDISADCTYKASNNPEKLIRLFDDDYTTSWKARAAKKGYIEINAPKGQTVGGVYVKWYGDAPVWRIAILEGNEWNTIAESSSGFLAEYLALPSGTARCRIYTGEGSKALLHMLELRVFSQGEPLPDVQRWQPVLEKCDLLVISAHPDDELLFMGGTIPYYAGELNKKIEVLYLVPTTPNQKLELLDGLWLCGNKNYPVYGCMRDNFSMSLKVMYQKWSKNKLYNLVTETIRRCKPDVIVTHDIKGEYGHGAHHAAADSTIHCVKDAANKRKYPNQVKEFGTWQVSKLYIHLYHKNPIVMDWRQPLTAFEGKTAFDITTTAFKLHRSQQNTQYVVKDSGKHDNRLFGLYMTKVGEDVKKNDFLENIEPSV